jgi:hypothetical protein
MARGTADLRYASLSRPTYDQRTTKYPPNRSNRLTFPARLADREGEEIASLRLTSFYQR